jgi:hypothetical protein
MSKHRSIGERLRKTKSLSVRQEIALEWAVDWINDHDQTLAQVERHLGQRQIAEAGLCLGQLKALNDKLMSALPRVIEALTDDDIL